MGDIIMEEREEIMVSPLGGDQFLRSAHFLKPTVPDAPPLSPPSKAQIFDVRDTKLQVQFRGTSWPQHRWKDWVHKLLPRYQNIWKAAGIFDSILTSTYKILRHSDLILALAERWCVETNTFVFPWGETTITLEDMIVLGGYSVLGDSILNPLSTEEMVTIEEKLLETKKKLSMCNRHHVSHLAWMDHFIDSNDELEHVAFLALWLSRYVFSVGFAEIATNTFPISIHLSVGTRLATAPPVLAILYRDLSLIKTSIISSSKKSSSKSQRVCARIYVWSPIQLVQIWAWERFPTLRPNPNLIHAGDPRCARWHEQLQPKVDDIRKVLNSAGKDFQWRPYCMVLTNWRFNEFYMTKGRMVNVEFGMDKEIESFALCIRPSELVGLESGIEQYLPHRVAMQFGFDQDIPDFVPRVNDHPNSAWENFKRPIGDKMFYTPPRLLESDVTFRYLLWWNRAGLVKEDRIESNEERLKLKGLKMLSEEDSLDEDNLTIGELFRFEKKANVVVNRAPKDVEMVQEPIDISSSTVGYTKELITSSLKVTGAETKDHSDDWDLEHRISKLERIFAMLKAEYIPKSSSLTSQTQTREGLAIEPETAAEKSIIGKEKRIELTSKRRKIAQKKPSDLMGVETTNDMEACHPLSNLEHQ